MDATTAMARTNAIIDQLVGGLTPEHREMSTPCAEWTVHELIGHVCAGGHKIAGGLRGQAPPEAEPDFLSDGPAAGWSGTKADLIEAATPDALAAMHQMPFGEVPGEMALGVIVADHLVHGWDLARATSQPFEVDDDLAEWALQTWQGVVPAEGRDGGGFADVVATSDGASALDRLVAYTGRTP